MKKFNLDELLYLIVLIIINASIIYLVHTSKMSFYIGEKMVKYMYFTIAALSVLICYQFTNVFTPKSSTSIKGKIVPIVFALLLGVIAVTNQNEVVHSELFDNILKEYDDEKNINYDIIGDKIIINETNIDILNDMKNKQDKYKDKIIEFDGFVCKEQYLKTNQFLVGKVIITCCGADSKIIGFLAQYDKCEELSENDNVKIKGIIDYTTINDSEGVSHSVPLIKITSLTKQPKVND